MFEYFSHTGLPCVALYSVLPCMCALCKCQPTWQPASGENAAVYSSQYLFCIKQPSIYTEEIQAKQVFFCKAKLRTVFFISKSHCGLSALWPQFCKHI